MVDARRLVCRDHRRWGRLVEPLLAAVVMAIAWFVLLRIGVWGDTGITDVPVYRAYGLNMVAGEIPFRDFAVEYPPLAFPVFWLPTLVATGPVAYAHAFGALMFLCAVAGLFAIDQLGRAAYQSDLGRRLALLFFALSPAFIGSVFRARFDVVPTVALLVALVALVRRREGVSGGLLGLGTAVKIFPSAALITTIAYVARRERHGAVVRHLAGFVAVGVLTLVPVVVVAGPDRVAEAAAFHLERPVQIESVSASLLLAARGLGFGDVTVTGTAERQSRFKSQGIEAGAASAVSLTMTVVGIGLLCWIGYLMWTCAQRRDAPKALIAAAFASILTFIVFGKVLSPQYLIWGLPLAGLLLGFGAWIPALTFVAAAVLTLVEFPGNYFALVDLDTNIVVLVAARNALLLASLGATLHLLRGVRRGSTVGRWTPRGRRA